MKRYVLNATGKLSVAKHGPIMRYEDYVAIKDILVKLLQADENGINPTDWENLIEKARAVLVEDLSEARAVLAKYKGES